MRKRPAIFPVIIVFIMLNALFLAGRNFLEKNGFDQEVLIVGNAILFAGTLLSFFLLKSGLKASNPNVFVRRMYLSTMLKLFGYIIAVFIYISLFRDTLNKPALLVCMGLYFVYTLLEVAILTRLMKQKKNV
jgi:hypothetical protein